MDIYDEILTAHLNTKDNPRKREFYYYRYLLKMMKSESIQPIMDSSLVFLMALFRESEELETKSNKTQNQGDNYGKRLIKSILLKELVCFSRNSTETE
ncbi:MAG: hypothetical protein ACTSYC_11255 [Promethearchaeota archaeon]